MGKTSLKNLKGIIFDLDGTLTDSLPGILQALNEVLRNHNYPEISSERCKNIIGNGIENLISRALPTEVLSNVNLSGYVAEMKKIYQRYLLSGTTLYPFIPDLLNSLTKFGKRFFIISNKHESAVKTIARKLLYHWNFEIIIGNSGQFPLKPSPEAVRYILEKTGLKQEEICLVGDGESDIETAKQAKILSIAVGWGYRTLEFLQKFDPDILILSPEEFKGMMSENIRDMR